MHIILLTEVNPLRSTFFPPFPWCCSLCKWNRNTRSIKTSFTKTGIKGTYIGYIKITVFLVSIKWSLNTGFSSLQSLLYTYIQIFYNYFLSPNFHIPYFKHPFLLLVHHRFFGPVNSDSPLWARESWIMA